MPLFSIRAICVIRVIFGSKPFTRKNAQPP